MRCSPSAQGGKSPHRGGACASVSLMLESLLNPYLLQPADPSELVLAVCYAELLANVSYEVQDAACR